MGWPAKKADYFTAAGYINTQRAFKFGITWPFWVRPGKASVTGPNGPNAGSARDSSNGTIGRGAQSAGGGRRQASMR